MLQEQEEKHADRCEYVTSDGKPSPDGGYRKNREWGDHPPGL